MRDGCPWGGTQVAGVGAGAVSMRHWSRHPNLSPRRGWATDPEAERHLGRCGCRCRSCPGRAGRTTLAGCSRSSRWSVSALQTVAFSAKSKTWTAPFLYTCSIPFSSLLVSQAAQTEKALLRERPALQTEVCPVRKPTCTVVFSSTKERSIF